MYYGHCSIIYKRQDMEATEVSSVDEWIKKITHTHTHTHTLEYYLAIKRDGILSLVTRADLKSIMLSEISQIEKDKYHMNSLIFGI